MCCYLLGVDGSRCPSGTTNPNSNNFDCITTPLDAITSANAGGSTTGAMGCSVEEPTFAPAIQIATAVATAKAADSVVMVGVHGSI